MKVAVSSFADMGNLAKERLVLKVLADTDIGRYAVFSSDIYSKPGKSGNPIPTSGRKRAYWFDDLPVKAGDLVVLYTKGGLTSKKVLDSGNTAHFFYWGLTAPIWEAAKTGVVVLSVDDWDFVPAARTLDPEAP